MFNNFIDYFSYNLSKFPNKTAVISTEKTLSYAELNEQSNNLAYFLLKKGVRHEEIILLLLTRSADMVVALLGILKSGCSFLPISPLIPPARKKFILEDSRARWLITDQPTVDTSSLTIKTIALNEINTQEKFTLSTLTQRQLAYVMYTSGSTGYPKGVLIEQAAMMNLFIGLIEELKLTEQDCVLALTDYTFDIALIELLMPLMMSATIVLTEQGTIADELKIKKHLERDAITLMQATPITWEILLKYGWRNTDALKILVGGEKFTTSLATLLDYCKGNVWNLYGPTETSMWSMTYHLKEHINTESVPLEKPLPNVTITLLDDHLDEVISGAIGELYIGGHGLARGYLQ